MDCILSYVATDVVSAMTDPFCEAGREMLDRVRLDPRASAQLLLLAHLYAKTDAASLARLRRELLRPKYSLADIATGTGVATAVIAGNHICHARFTLCKGRLSTQHHQGKKDSKAGELLL